MSKIIIPNEIITNKIYFVRNQKVMIDSDLAELFQVVPKRLREQVKRNIEKFPEHFMFRLNEIEVEMMITEKAIVSKQVLGGSLPYVFTEHGVLQLANVLKSERATQMSIKIIEIFVEMRNFLTGTLNLALEVELIDKQDNKVERKKIGYKE